ncbi:RICIN domain-containing protein [Kineococcus arenarius]|uniref:RICIN domain-containing protein n=1 Tax=Kineococcus sp. SYSU DK021 TaxID=3383142 RepID=UPI003D7DF8FD
MENVRELITDTLLARRRALRGADDGVAMLLVIMTTMIAAALSILLLGIVIAQVAPTQLQQKSTVTISAAQAGVDAALSEIRTARGAANVAGNVFGDTSKLPCTLTGTVGAGSSEVGYTVRVEYYDTDPTDLTTTQRAGRDIDCTAGSGTAMVPSYAIIKSEGTGAALPGRSADSGDRSIQALYAFEITNENVPGGRMYTVSEKYCLKAASATAGSLITYTAAANCTAGDSLMTWLYDTDYALKLASSITTGSPLCISAPNSSTGDATLQKCDAADYKQQWSYEGGARFRDQVYKDNGTANSSTYGSYCLAAATTTVSALEGSRLRSGSCTSNTEYGSFSPEPKVGAGAASYKTNQIVNYLEFGRCMDVTNQSITYSYMIVYPCKQDPSGGTQLSWNHKWYYTEATATQPTTGAQQIYVLVNNSTKYCLQTPTSGTTNGYVIFTKSCSSTDARQKFYRTYKVEGDYSASYTIKDDYGRCLSLGAKGTPSGSATWSTITAAACTGGTEQKWNAPAGAQESVVTDTRETTYDNP